MADETMAGAQQVQVEQPQVEQPQVEHPQVEQTETQPQPDYKALYEQLKADSRKWENRAKDNAEKAKAYDELQAQSKTLEQQVADIRDQLNRTNMANLRLKVASETGVPENLLFGSSETELREHADAILKLVDAAKVKPAAPVIPTDGKTPDNAGQLSTLEQQVHNLFGGR